MLIGEHILVIEPICSGTVERIRAGPRGEDCLQSSSPAVLDRECIDLNTRFLNGLRLRGKVQYTLANAAGDIEAVNNILIVVLSLAVRTSIHLLLSREVIHTRRRTARTTRTQA